MLDKERVPLREKDPFSEAALRAAALAYLTRYSASAGHVAQVLERRMHRYRDCIDEPSSAIRTRIDAVVARLVESGLINDRDYAAMKAMSLHRCGKSDLHIKQILRTKGVSDALVSAALADLDEMNGPDRERIAAARLARRRGLGPWAHVDRRAQRRTRDISAMVRAGYSTTLAIWIIDMDRIEAEILLETTG